jgi:hypothetical protein
MPAAAFRLYPAIEMICRRPDSVASSRVCSTGVSERGSEQRSPRPGAGAGRAMQRCACVMRCDEQRRLKMSHPLRRLIEERRQVRARRRLVRVDADKAHTFVPIQSQAAGPDCGGGWQGQVQLQIVAPFFLGGTGKMPELESGNRRNQNHTIVCSVVSERWRSVAQVEDRKGSCLVSKCLRAPRRSRPDGGAQE